MNGKVIVSAISIILVVGVVVGVVALVHHSGSSSSSSVSDDKDEKLSSSMKVVSTLCRPALYKDACIKSLAPIAQNHSAVPKDYVKAAVKMAFDETSKASALVDTLNAKVSQSKNVERAKMSIEECKNLFELAVERLNAAIERIGNADAYKDEDKTWQLRLWLSDAITFSNDCADSFEDDAPDLHQIMKDGTVNATELTMSVLDIVTSLSKLLGDNGIDTSKLTELATAALNGDKKQNSRRLLSMDMPVGADGYPTWISVADRRLLRAKRSAIAPNAVVAKDGSGQYKTIQAAVNAYPKGFKGRYIIYVKAGLYTEPVLIKKAPNIFMYGDGPERTVVTGSKSFAKGVQTSNTASFAVESPRFQCTDMGFQNTAGPDGHQAVALRVNGEQAVFFRCRFDAFQDTLYPQGGSQFFRDCTISGTVDFIFGNGATLIQNCRIIVRKPNPNQFNAVTAQGRLGPSEPTGIVIKGCEILADKDLFATRFITKTYLGRPWKPYARTVFMETMMGDLIQPDGYSPWSGTVHLDTCMYGEYANRGPGANTARRIRWRNVKVLNRHEALQFTAERFLKGGPIWIRDAAVPVDLSLRA